MEDIEKCRQKIDELDEKIQQLLIQRFTYTDQIGQYKKEKKIAVLNSQREDEINHKIEEKYSKKEADTLKNIYQEIMKESRQRQL